MHMEYNYKTDIFLWNIQCVISKSGNRKWSRIQYFKIVKKKTEYKMWMYWKMLPNQAKCHCDFFVFAKSFRISILGLHLILSSHARSHIKNSVFSLGYHSAGEEHRDSFINAGSILPSPIQIHATKPRLEGKIVWPLYELRISSVVTETCAQGIWQRWPQRDKCLSTPCMTCWGRSSCKSAACHHGI